MGKIHPLIMCTLDICLLAQTSYFRTPFWRIYLCIFTSGNLELLHVPSVASCMSVLHMLDFLTCFEQEEGLHIEMHFHTPF
jgi:hypothetical protein